MITLCNFSIYDSTNWILDTGSPVNIFNSLKGLQVRRRFKNSKRFLSIRDGRSIPVQALGVIEFVFESRVVVLNDCHFCPSFILNVISVGQLAKENFEFSIKNVMQNEMESYDASE